jgi:hypothetical protein
MIRFANVTKRAPIALNDGSPFLLKNASINLPVDWFIELESPLKFRREQFFDLVSGVILPDRGHILRKGIRVSPLLNRPTANASLLFNHFTLRENINFQARLSFIRPSLIADFVETACATTGPMFDQKMSGFAPKLRVSIEAAIFTIIPFDCYLIDQFNTLPELLQMELAYAIKFRRAGLYFSIFDRFKQMNFRRVKLSFESHMLELRTAVG